MQPYLVYLNSVASRLGRLLEPVVLLLIRGWWGWSFFLTGKGKLLHLDRTADFFASLHIPLARANATVAGAVECIGGLLVLAGLGARLAALPLIFTLAVAYATAERDALTGLFSDPDKFTGATPFPFLLAMLIVLTFGPGKLSLDHWLGRANATATARTALAGRLDAVRSAD